MANIDLSNMDAGATVTAAPDATPVTPAQPDTQMAGPDPSQTASADNLANDAASQMQQVAAPAPQKPSMWKNVLKGALAGLELGGGVGAFEGAIDPSTAIQAKQNLIAQGQTKRAFASLQAADEMLQFQKNRHDISTWPQQMQLAQAKLDTPIAEQMVKNGWMPVAQSQGFGDSAAVAAHRNLQAAYPNGIPANLIKLYTGSGVMYFDPSQANPTQFIQGVNLYQAAKGQTPVTVAQWQDKSLMSPGSKADLLKKSGEYWHPIAKDLKSAVALKDQYLADELANQNMPDDGSGLKQQAHDRLEQVIGNLDDQIAHQRSLEVEKANRSQKLAIATADARGKAYQDNKYGNFLDEQGALVTTTMKDAANRNLSPASGGTKAMAQASQLNDIIQGDLNFRDAIKQMSDTDQSFSDPQIVSLQLAMRAPDDAAYRTVIDKTFGNQQLTSEQKNFVANITQLHERAMALRSVAGIGQRSSDMMMQAVAAMLPNIKDDPELMMDKINLFEQQLQVLSRGIPKVQHQPAPGSEFTNRTVSPLANQKQNTGMITVNAPNGKTYHFKDQASADHFKQLAGIK